LLFLVLVLFINFVSTHRQRVGGANEPISQKVKGSVLGDWGKWGIAREVVSQQLQR